MKTEREIHPKLIPALILLLVVIVFIALFAYVMYYWENQRNVELPADSGGASEGEQACIELGCPKGSIYAGSVNSDKYYDCDCRYAKNINPENLVCFSSDNEALNDERVKSEC